MPTRSLPLSQTHSYHDSPRLSRLMVAAYLTKPSFLSPRGANRVAMRWDAVVFDLDGTLVDTAPDLHAHLNEMLSELGRPGFALEDVRPMIGDGARALLRRGLDASGGMPEGVDIEALFAEFLRRYTARPLRFGTIFDGAKPNVIYLVTVNLDRERL